MLLSGHQPVYLPSLHLFSKIALSDAFMFVGHCQIVSYSWHTRNSIRMGKNRLLLSVPIKRMNNFGQSINETVVDGDHWKRKHLASIRQAYVKRPFFNQYFPEIEDLIKMDHGSLGAMNIALIEYFLNCMKIDTHIYYSEDYGVKGHKTDMIISMCESLEADKFYSNEGTRVYLEEEFMVKKGINHFWQKFTHPVYDQGKHSFLENLSVLDAIFNMGGEKTGRIVKNSSNIIAGPYNVNESKLQKNKLNNSCLKI